MRISGEKILKAHDGDWRRMAAPELSPPPGRDGYRRLDDWLGSNSDPADVQIFVTRLNVAFGSQDAQATVRDAIAGDWVTVESLLKRVKVLPPDRRAAYQTLFENLNRNDLMVTPSSPAECVK